MVKFLLFMVKLLVFMFSMGMGDVFPYFPSALFSDLSPLGRAPPAGRGRRIYMYIL